MIASALGLDNLFNGVKDKLVTLGGYILNLPSSIAENIKGFFENIGDKLVSIGELVLDVPEKILEGIKGIIVPDDGYIEDKLAYLTEEFNRLGIGTYDMSGIMSTETALADITGTYGGKSVTFVNMKVVDTVVVKFRPVIRGFMWLMLVIYNYNQFMGLIGQQALTLGSMIRSFREGDKE